MDFYTYQKGNVIYGYQGLIGRISPILVHISLLLILFGSSLGAFKSFKAEEGLPKGEIFRIQNPTQIGYFTPLPTFNIRVNDFWVEYKENRIHQFYSNLSILDNFGNEKFQETISVNHPLRYQNIDLYQSDWNLLGIRIEIEKDKIISEVPFFSFQKMPKSWITWVPKALSFNDSLRAVGPKTLIFDQLQNVFFVEDNSGQFFALQNINDFLKDSGFSVLEILPATGLLIKYNPSIPILYFGFACLIFTTLFSYLPFTQIWLCVSHFEQTKGKNKDLTEEILWLGTTTNRGKIQLEIQFENILRSLIPF
jgi:cytochrome c biogenesis protein